MIDCRTPISSGGKKVNTEPDLGITENDRSDIAASKAVQLIDPLDSVLENSVLKVSNVSFLTLKIGEVFEVSDLEDSPGSGQIS